MLRKWTMKIFPWAPKVRIASGTSVAGSTHISETVPWQKLSPCTGLSQMERRRFRPSTLPRTQCTPRNPVSWGTAGSCGWQARRTPASSATGTTRSRK